VVVARAPTVIWQGVGGSPLLPGLGRMGCVGGTALTQNPAPLAHSWTLEEKWDSFEFVSLFKYKPDCFQEKAHPTSTPLPPLPHLVHRSLGVTSFTAHPRLQDPSCTLGSDVALGCI
jgi:hypothetical protein